MDDALPAQPVHPSSPARPHGHGHLHRAGVRGRLEARAGVNGRNDLARRRPRPDAARGQPRDRGRRRAARPVAGVRHRPPPPRRQRRRRLGLRQADRGRRDPLPKVEITGRTAIDRLATVDAHAAEDPVRWGPPCSKAFVASAPFGLAIADIGLSGSSPRLIAADRTINLTRVFGAAPPTAGGRGVAEVDPGPSDAHRRTDIDTATTRGALGLRRTRGRRDPAPRSSSPRSRCRTRFAFIDRWSARGPHGRDRPAGRRPDLLARLDHHRHRPPRDHRRASAAVGHRQGDPLAPTLPRPQGHRRRFDLPAVSPYSGTFAGYAIERGSSTSTSTQVRPAPGQVEDKFELHQFDFGLKVVARPKAPTWRCASPSRCQGPAGRDHAQPAGVRSLDDTELRLGRSS